MINSLVFVFLVCLFLSFLSLIAHKEDNEYLWKAIGQYNLCENCVCMEVFLFLLSLQIQTNKSNIFFFFIILKSEKQKKSIQKKIQQVFFWEWKSENYLASSFGMEPFLNFSTLLFWLISFFEAPLLTGNALPLLFIEESRTAKMIQAPIQEEKETTKTAKWIPTIANVIL